MLFASCLHYYWPVFVYLSVCANSTAKLDNGILKSYAMVSSSVCDQMSHRVKLLTKTVCFHQVVLTASNANVGGPATAAAMAASRGWPHMVRPAMLTGSLGYAVGTGIGCAVSQWLQVL